jgi:hypothetical protein
MTSTSTVPAGRPWPTQHKAEPAFAHLRSTRATPVTPQIDRLFADTADGFARAETILGAVEADIAVAGHRFRIRLAGEALAHALLPALERCRAPGHDPLEPTAEFCAWDSAESGIDPPRPPWSRGDYLPRDEVRGSGEAGIDASYALADRILALWRRSDRRGLFWANDGRALPAWEPTAPLRNLFSWALVDFGLVLAHAAVVGTAAGGVLLAGRGGSGKSTTAMVCVDAGWRYVSDDYCVLDASEQPTAHALYGTAKLWPEALARLPRLAAAAAYQRDDAKLILDLTGSFSGSLTECLPLRAVVVPTVAPATGTLRRLPVAAGARALAPSTLFQIPGARGSSLGVIAEILRRVPVFGLDVGPDFEAIPDALSRAMEEGSP